jgi:hypothetical protein
VVGNAAANRRGALEGRRVASVTICRAECVVVAYMARRARSRRRRYVRAGQRKSSRTVIEGRHCEAHRCVTGGAVGHSECWSG